MEGDQSEGAEEKNMRLNSGPDSRSPVQNTELSCNKEKLHHSSPVWEEGYNTLVPLLDSAAQKRWLRINRRR